MLASDQEARITDLGGYDAWETYSDAEKDRVNQEVYDAICVRLGEVVFEKLSPAERTERFLFVWTGCSMHKELNSVKGGKAGMDAYWDIADIRPLKLMNRDNSVAAQEVSTVAAKRAELVSESGAIKLTSLAGAIFVHKDHKKGQQDTFRIYFERELGYSIRFPDTSNTRYQSHCCAASVLVVHRHLILSFLDLVRLKKESGTFNHMENNVYRGLQDIPTLIELCVLVLYSQSVSHCYMRQIRAESSLGVNALDLKPVHDAVKQHCNKLIEDPELILNPAVSSSYTDAAMDGLPWEEPEAMYTVQRLFQTDLAGFTGHLRGAFLAFLKGARDTWQRFTAEFDDTCLISTLTPAQRDTAFMPPTNDHNEGALGGFRVAQRFAPQLSILQHNGRKMYSANDTASFFRTLDKATHTWIRKKARELDAGGEERKRRQKQAEYDREKAAKKQEEESSRKTKKAAELATLKALPPISVCDLGK